MKELVSLKEKIKVIKEECSKQIDFHHQWWHIDVMFDDVLKTIDHMQENQKPEFKIGDVIHKIGEPILNPLKIKFIDNGDYICEDNGVLIRIVNTEYYELV